MEKMVYKNERIRPAQVLERGKYIGYEYIILSLGTHPCAYICLDENEMFYGKHYDEIDINCHYGLTYSEPHLYFGEYSEKYKCIVKTSIKDKWVIGWDYAHYGDRYGGIDDGTNWTTQTIKLECKQVIQQIIMQSITQGYKKILNQMKEIILPQIIDKIWEDYCYDEYDAREIDIDTLHDIMLQCKLFGKKIEDNDNLYYICNKVLDKFGEEMVDEVNCFIDEECQSYYLDPAFSSASDYWNYILG